MKQRTGMKKLQSALFVFVLMNSSSALASDLTTSWHDDSKGMLVIMRHAIAPGTGDPDDFELRDCSTQRNLSKPGREQARRIGEKIKQAGIQNAQVFSSQWCRCLETASEMNIGTTIEQPYLNSFFGRRELESTQMVNLRAWIKSLEPNKVTVLVTHQVVITSLTGVYPASGDAVIFNITDDDEIQIKGTISAE